MGLSENRSPPWAAAIAGLALLGCAGITGIDEYSVGGGEREVTACPSGEAPAGPGGECIAVGVVGECGKGFVKDDRGGCEVILPGPCDPGLIAVPGLTQCIAPANCASRYALDSLPPNGSYLYVDAAAQKSGDGMTTDTPFKTIMEAVRAAAPDTTGIVIAGGEYVESVEIAAPLTLYGACPRATTEAAATILRGPPGESRPVVHFSSTASSGAVNTLQIVGGTAGLAAEGPVELNFGGLWIHDVGGPGILLAKGVTATGVGSLIEKTLGAGIVLEGATLDAGKQGELSVRGTRALADGREGYGIALHPSRDLTDVPISSTAPFRLSSIQSKLTLNASVLDDNAGAGLFVEGSTAVVMRSVIRNTRANGLGEGRGIVVQQRALGPIPASLELKQTTIEGSTDVGVLVVDSPALSDGTAGVVARIESTTIRNVSGVERAEGTPCLGNGLRVRADGPSSSEPAIVLKNSLIEGAHEAGVHVQGARVQVSESIVRGTAACASDFGDGIAVLGDARVRAAVSVVGSRIEGSARAGVASFGADVSVNSSVIETSGVVPIALVERGGVPATPSVLGSACGAEKASTACRAKPETLAPPLVGGNGCDAFAEQGVCFSMCWDSVVGRLSPPGADPSKSVLPLPRLVMWAPDRLEIAASIAGDDGCNEWGGLPANAKQVWAHALDGFMPATWWQTTGSGNSIPGRFVATLSAVTGAYSNLGLPFDARMAPLDSVVACHPPDDSFKNQPTEPCVGRGVQGLQLEAESSGAAGPTYVSATGAPQPVTPGLTITSASYGSFVNAPPGDFIVRILPPASGSRVDCTGDAFGTGWSAADLLAPDRVRLPARRGFNPAATVFCEVR